MENDVSIIDAVIHRGRGVDVDAVLVDGEPIVKDRRPTRFDRVKLLEELRKSLARPLHPRELERQELGRALEPYLRRFYVGAADSAGLPHACYNAR